MVGEGVGVLVGVGVMVEVVVGVKVEVEVGVGKSCDGEKRHIQRNALKMPMRNIRSRGGFFILILFQEKER